MNEREIFLSALEIDDPTARQAHVQAACAGDQALLARVESLLAKNDDQSQFLETPVAVQLECESDRENRPTILLGSDSTQDNDDPNGSASMTTNLEDDHNAEIPLDYLEPSSKPDSLGRLGHYEILEIVGRGAFGIVLKAFDEKLQRVVAIKVLAPEMAATSPARKRFLREARASAAIRHENVVAIHAVEEQPLPYLVMDYIPGETLQKRLDDTGPLAVPTVLQVGRQIALGLAAAHAQDLIHRDIKPANILLEAGVHEHVKLTDFGLARAADDASVTQSGLIAGTPMYMAPEQALGQKLDHRADLFSLGSVLYQMVSGRPPFRAATTLAVLKRVTEDTPRPINEVIPETPQWLCDIITRLHAKNPDERFQTAREVADLLASCDAQLKLNAHLQDLSRIPPVKSPARSQQWKWATAVVLLLPFVALAATEIAGVTHVFRGQQVTTEPDKPGVVTLRFSDATMEFQLDDVGANRTGVFVLQVPLDPGEHSVWFKLGNRQYRTAKFQVKAGERSTLELAITSDGGQALLNGQSLAVADAISDADGWVQLFNHKDLTGWKFHPDQLGHWEVKDGILRGSVRQSYLFSERGDYRNFHLRAEVKVNLGGNSGILMRAPFELQRGRLDNFGIPGCYEVELQLNRSYPWATGSISATTEDAHPTNLGQIVDRSLTQPDEWFTIEVIAENNHFITKINGVEAVNCKDPLDRHHTGHLVLQVWHPNTVVQFRKIEIKELPTSSSEKATPPLAVAPFDTEQAKDHQVAWANHLGVPIDYTNSIGMKFRLIPPGEFLMGSTPEQVDESFKAYDLQESDRQSLAEIIRSASPQHRVVLTQPIYLGVHEVTQQQFEQVLGRNPSAYSPTGRYQAPVKGIDTQQFPVEQVSWNDAAEFCAKLSERERLTPFDFQNRQPATQWNGTGYRLPTEAEWEAACRAGTTTKYWVGDNEQDLAQSDWLANNSERRPHPVGELRANPFGLFDVHGNVEELVLDWWDPNYYSRFKSSPAIDPIGPTTPGRSRVMRGGRFAHAALIAQSSKRGVIQPVGVVYFLGFRVALSVDAVKQKQRAEDSKLTLLRSFTPGKDKLPVPLRPEGKEVVTVEGDAWRIENSGQGGNFNVMIAHVLDDIPQDGVLVFRAKVRVDAKHDLTGGNLGFGGANHLFISWDQWPDALTRYDGKDSEWVEKEVRHLVSECRKSDPPAIYLYAGLHADGVVWLKDLQLLHLPANKAAAAPE